MTTKTVIFIILGVISFGVSLLVKKNKKDSNETRKKMLDRVNQAKKVDAYRNSSDFQHPISNSIVTLLENFNVHGEVSEKLNDKEIELIEEKLELSFPYSYKIFLKYFGDGGSWVYSQDIDNIQNYSWLGDYRKNLGETIQLEEKVIRVDSLLCLMTEDSNGGAWCWLTSKGSDKKEWPLAYYSEGKLHYKVENFTEWLKILTETGHEIIRELDVEEKLGLG
jgi:hypothetical protein